MHDLTCPNCGDRIDPRVAGFRQVVCGSCGTTLLIEDEAVRQAGQAGVMHEVPMPFGLGDRVQAAGRSYDILGHARYSYGRGWWDEFQAVDDTGARVWIAVDEGDIAIQTPMEDDDRPTAFSPPALGARVMLGGVPFHVREVDRAECIAIRGGFDEPLAVGETYDFVNCSALDGRILSGEFWTNWSAWFLGHWVDPFDVRVEPR